MKLYLAFVCELLLFKNVANLLLYFGISDSDKNEIVVKHNELRTLLKEGKVEGQPQATDMKTMNYDDQLAKAAQDISNTCIYDHALVVDARWWYVGQNLYMYMTTSTTRRDWSYVIQKWFDEYKNYNYAGEITSGTAHYTQIAWADTEFVGCGYTKFYWPPITTIYHFYVCNYGPGGNFYGIPPYITT